MEIPKSEITALQYIRDIQGEDIYTSETMPRETEMAIELLNKQIPTPPEYRAHEKIPAVRKKLLLYMRCNVC